MARHRHIDRPAMPKVGVRRRKAMIACEGGKTTVAERCGFRRMTWRRMNGRRKEGIFRTLDLAALLSFNPLQRRESWQKCKLVALVHTAIAALPGFSILTLHHAVGHVQPSQSSAYNIDYCCVIMVWYVTSDHWDDGECKPRASTL